MKITPLAVPGRWRTRVRPATSTRRPLANAASCSALTTRRPSQRAQQGHRMAAQRQAKVGVVLRRPPRRASSAAGRPRARARAAPSAQANSGGWSSSWPVRSSPIADHSAPRRSSASEPKASARARRSSAPALSPARRRSVARSAIAVAARARPGAPSPPACSPLTWRKPRRSARSEPVRRPRSSVQSQSLALTSTGRTSTPCSRASRTSWAGA